MLKLKPTPTHEFPDLFPARSQALPKSLGAAGLMPFK
jgi:hypothetical protein